MYVFHTPVATVHEKGFSGRQWDSVGTDEPSIAVPKVENLSHDVTVGFSELQQVSHESPFRVFRSSPSAEHENICFQKSTFTLASVVALSGPNVWAAEDAARE